jgi:membrane protein implicated in regulation of membrane protease activity
MEFEIWHIWIIIAVLLFILEIFTPAFLAACLAIGCLFAGIFASMDFGVKIQLLAFSIGTIISFFGVRPFILKYGHKKNGDLKTNVDALVGKIGKVTITIDNFQNQGRVTVEGDDWKAESENNEILNAGERVKIMKVDSTILTVKLIKKEN